MTLVLYELEPLTGEANGHVFYYCSDECRQIDTDRMAKADAPVCEPGESTEAITGTVCEHCGSIIVRA